MTRLKAEEMVNITIIIAGKFNIR
uniref:Uncharacterized protein n=1 Tax=Tetranychus urticae TaxID=32264 RepID=T1L4B1_TETUR